MTIKSLAVGGALLSACVCGAAEEAATEMEAEETSFVSAEVSLSFDSRYLSYGFVDNKDPILTPAGSLTFADWLTVGVNALFDTTKYGRKAGYTNREWKYIELHPNASIGHAFSPDDFEWLPTTVEWSIGYDYEYHPDAAEVDDTQFWTVEVGLTDLWLEPWLCFERDTMRDSGTYVSLELGHTFSLIDGESEDDDPVLSLRPSIAQGFGNAMRVRAYAIKADGEPLDHSGFMDTLAKLELSWAICDCMTLSGYVGYSDFLLDRKIREAAREYEASGEWHESYNFITGLCLTASF